MTRFLFGALLWDTIERHAKSAHRRKAAIAYVTKAQPIGFKSGDLLIVDATDKAVGSGQTSAAVLAGLHRKGVRLYCHVGLHAKFLIIDSVLFASSANLSASSTDDLLEAGIQTDSPNSISEAAALLDRLVRSSTPIDDKFLKRIKLIPVTRHFSAGKSAVRAVSKRQRPPLTWLIGVHDIEEATDTAELKRIEKGKEKAEQRVSDERSDVGWIRMPRSARVRSVARDGDNVILIDRGSPDSDPERVFRHTAILEVQKEPNCTRAYYEELPFASRRALTWGQFKKVAKLARVPGALSKNTTRQLSYKVSDDLKDYWAKGRQMKRPRKQ
jgi:PLD-like domain